MVHKIKDSLSSYTVINNELQEHRNNEISNKKTAQEYCTTIPTKITKDLCEKHEIKVSLRFSYSLPRSSHTSGIMETLFLSLTNDSFFLLAN